MSPPSERMTPQRPQNNRVRFLCSWCQCVVHYPYC